MRSRERTNESIVEAEVHHFRVDDAMAERLATLHEALRRRAEGSAPALEVAGEEAFRVCTVCRQDLAALGLPYRIVMSCTHEG